MIEQAIVLAQSLEEGILNAAPEDAPVVRALKLVASVALPLVSLYFAYVAANSRTLAQSAGNHVAGLLLATGTTLGRGGLEWLPLGVLVYLVAGPAIEIFFLRREKELPLWLSLAAAGIVAFYAATGSVMGTFVLGAATAVFGGLKVVFVREVVHATLWLAVSLMGVAGLFFSVGAEFLALVQVLIYVGAVITLILFTVMLTIPVEESHFLSELELPPGYTIESVQDLQTVVPGFVEVGPMKALQDTNPRKAPRMPETLYGVSIADGVFGTELTEKRHGKGQKEGN